MRVLYALNGVGNGHVSRAREVIPHLAQLSDVDVVVSGNKHNVPLPNIPHQRLQGITFALGDKGGIDYAASLRELRVPKVLQELRSTKLREYDCAVIDFEPITARAARRDGVPSIAFSHQAAFLSPQTPRPERRNPWYEFLLRHYAPCDHSIGLHFAAYDSFIRLPIIRREVRELSPRDEGHYTVYLPGYGDEYLIELLREIPDIEWQVFSRPSAHIFHVSNVAVTPISNVAYLASLERCRGLLTGGGFEAPAEALFLGKT